MSGRSVAFLNGVPNVRPRPSLPAIAGILLILASGLLFGFLPRYAVLGGQRLVDPELRMGQGETVPEGWRRIGKGGVIRRTAEGLRLTARSRTEKVGLAQILERPGDADAMRIRGRLAVPELDARRGEYRGARLIAAADRPSGPYRFNGRPVARLFGPAPMTDYAMDVRIPERRGQVGVALLITAARGSMLVQRVELYWLRERAGFRLLRLSLAAGWGLWLVVAGWRFWREAHWRPPALLLVAGMALVLVLDLLPHRGGIPADAQWLRPISGFAIGFLAALARQRDPLWLRALLVVSLMAAIELAQIFGPGIGLDDLTDFGRGAAGALAGLAAALALRLQRQRF